MAVLWAGRLRFAGLAFFLRSSATSNTQNSLDLAIAASVQSGAPLPADAKRTHQFTRKVTLLLPVSNTTDYKGMPGNMQIDRAALLATTLRQLGSLIPLAALTHGYGRAAEDRLKRSGYVIHDLTSIPLARFAKSVRHAPEPLRKWPRSGQAQRVQKRQDAAGLSLKLFAWTLTQYDAVLMVDTDVIFEEDPLPWMRQRLAEGEYFLAPEEIESRNYAGLNIHLAFLRPNVQVYRILQDAATHGNFVPYTNGIQDVIEEVFTSHRKFPVLAHTHSHDIFCLCGQVSVLSVGTALCRRNSTSCVRLCIQGPDARCRWMLRPRKLMQLDGNNACPRSLVLFKDGNERCGESVETTIQVSGGPTVTLNAGYEHIETWHGGKVVGLSEGQSGAGGGGGEAAVNRKLLRVEEPLINHWLRRHVDPFMIPDQPPKLALHRGSSRRDRIPNVRGIGQTL